MKTVVKADRGQFDVTLEKPSKEFFELVIAVNAIQGAKLVVEVTRWRGVKPTSVLVITQNLGHEIMVDCDENRLAIGAGKKVPAGDSAVGKGGVFVYGDRVAVVTGDRGVAQGSRAVAAGPRGIAVGGNCYGGFDTSAARLNQPPVGELNIDICCVRPTIVRLTGCPNRALPGDIRVDGNGLDRVIVED